MTEEGAGPEHPSNEDPGPGPIGRTLLGSSGSLRQQRRAAFGELAPDLEQLLVSIEAREQVMAASLRIRVMRLFGCDSEDDALRLLRAKALGDEDDAAFYKLLLQVGWEG